MEQSNLTYKYVQAVSEQILNLVKMLLGTNLAWCVPMSQTIEFRYFRFMV